MNVQVIPSVAATAVIPQSPEPKLVHRTKLKDFLREQEGSFVSLEFTKKDGSARTLVGRLGVRKHVRGGINPAIRQDTPYIVLFDVQKSEYRNVNLATVHTLRADHTQYTVIG